MNLPRLKVAQFTPTKYGASLKVFVTVIQDSVFVLPTLMLCAESGQVAFHCARVSMMMITCCNKQEAVVQGPNSRDRFSTSDSTDVMFLFVSVWLPCAVFDLDQKEGRMFQSMMPLRFSLSDNITHSTALVTALDNVTSLSPTTTQATNDTNITVPHKCLLLLYEDIGKSR